MDLNEILAKTAAYQVRHVTVTGGEPLAQPATYDLLHRLCDAGYRVSLETSGAIDISPVDCRVMKVVDIKTPAQGNAIAIYGATWRIWCHRISSNSLLLTAPITNGVATVLVLRRRG